MNWRRLFTRKTPTLLVDGDLSRRDMLKRLGYGSVAVALLPATAKAEELRIEDFSPIKDKIAFYKRTGCVASGSLDWDLGEGRADRCRYCGLLQMSMEDDPRCEGCGAAQ